MQGLTQLVDLACRARDDTDPGRSTLVAVSGIDGSGKGYAAARAAALLEQRGLRVAAVNIDAFLNLPRIRFGGSHPAAHFYANAFRFDVLFERLLLPLRRARSIDVELDTVEETDTAYRRRRYVFDDIDVILVEGIYLLRRSLRPAYDLSCWIDCSFDTALERAVARAQEGLPPADTIRAYRAIYFPAQELHFRLDQPREAATLVVDNDCARKAAASSRPM